ncbi:MAG: hypothetical protein LBD67_01245 [Candidatus Accumulibacter sp.]|jgi:DNA-binding phage protein|nr:hypothetical protein [Accumulibacter sp.]
MTGKLKTRRWDVLEHLKMEEEIQGFLQACFEEAEDNPAFIAQALGFRMVLQTIREECHAA